MESHRSSSNQLFVVAESFRIILLKLCFRIFKCNGSLLHAPCCFKELPCELFLQVDATDASYPSVNTCVHYLKLPEYSSEEIMRERLLAATMEKGFHLN